MGERPREKDPSNTPEQNTKPESGDSGKTDWSRENRIYAERQEKERVQKQEEARIANMTPEELSEEVIRKLREAETPEQIVEARGLSRRVLQKLGGGNRTQRGMEILKRIADADFEGAKKRLNKS